MNNLVSIAPLQGDYLEHAGIKGMKWGIRRYQNPDGSLTEEGRRRYRKNHPDYTRAHSKNIQDMSDEELRNAVNRLNNEKQYTSMTTRKKKNLLEIGKTAVAVGSTILAVEAVGSKLVTKGQEYIDKLGDYVISDLAEGLSGFRI